MVELLAPAGDRKKLNTAFHFGADAVYVGGDLFSLRAFANNFDNNELQLATEYAHSINKKIYVAVNIFASNSDFKQLEDYLKFLEKIKVDAIIASDIGIISFSKKVAPKLPIHLSTQANTTNKYAVDFWADLGVERVVLARELPLKDIIEIKQYVGDKVELETFIHGAMCISYSGRCLLSNYLTNRNSNRGECVQACRWEYKISEVNRTDNPLTVQQDNKGTYLLNSNDMNMLAYVDELLKAGISSLKIEGRMKSEYYVGSVVSAYRRAIDIYNSDPNNFKLPKKVLEELEKTSHRGYSQGFYFSDKSKNANVNLESSIAKCDYKFMAQVLGYDLDRQAIIVEQRNRFKVGDTLEILSNNEYFATPLIVEKMEDEAGNEVDDAKRVQQKLWIKTDKMLSKYDMLRKKI